MFALAAAGTSRSSISNSFSSCSFAPTTSGAKVLLIYSDRIVRRGAPVCAVAPERGPDQTLSLSENVGDRAGRSYARFTQCVFQDRKSTRLNSSHLGISYAVF